MQNVIAEMKQAATEDFDARRQRSSGPAVIGRCERSVNGKSVMVQYGRKGFIYSVRDEKGNLDAVTVDDLEALAAANRVEAFQKYCVDAGDTEALEDALFFSPDEADLEHWQITESEYLEAVRGAIEVLKLKDMERIDEVINGQESFVAIIAEGKRQQAVHLYENYMHEHRQTIADWEERTLTKRGISNRNRRIEDLLRRTGDTRMADYHRAMADKALI